MKGSWEPFEKKGNTAKKYELEKRDFVYDASNGLFEASSRLLDETDVQNEALEDLTLMRNEIYARHGYCFKDKDMRYHFEQEDWYMPMGVDIRHELTDIEIANITLIYEYEEYYEEYTDDFGR
ncbi:MAG: YARHG domain-containing protein [Crocinitomicaceae bacterium]|nr:YARHG domain-containing protein [Crocinitomicaceae bacterium]